MEQAFMNQRILVADDDAAMRALISVSLSDLGEVEEAADGREAVAKMKQTRFALALLDWQMPKPDGLTVLRIIRAAGLTTPVIMVTAQAERSHVMEAIQAGASDYLLKPFSSDDLCRKVQRFFPPVLNQAT
jgi:two-component system, chemotaxis family, chemotaxis protein CheY